MLLPFQEALRDLQGKAVMPTSLDSAGIRAMEAAVRRQSLLSARTVMEEYLERVKSVCESLVNPVEVDGVAKGFDTATARMALREELRRLDYQPEEDTEGTLTDLSSDARIDLVVKTNQQLAQGAGAFVRENDPEMIDLWPAWELYRLEPRAHERDWGQRWMIAASVAGDAAAAAALGMGGKMAALKSSGIWQALGDGAGGYNDSLGNPYPPFAFGSGMWTRELSREEAEALNLIGAGERAEGNVLDLGKLFSGGEGE